jgi:PAS domain S-box-containing protein
MAASFFAASKHDVQNQPFARFFEGSLPAPGASVETTLLCPGRPVTVRVSLSPVLSDGRIIGTITQTTGQADPSGNQSQLSSEGACYLRGIIQCVPDAVVTVDRQGRVVEWNPGAERLFEWTSTEAAGRDLDQLLGVDEASGNTASSVRVVSGERVVGIECLRYSKSLRKKFVRLSAAPIEIGTEIVGGVAIYTDIEERREIEEKLRENEILFSTITDTAQDAVIIMNPLGQISFFNSAAETMFGYRRHEVEGLDLHKLLAPEPYREMFTAGFEEFRRTGQGVVINRVLEIEAQRKDGVVFPVELAISAFQSGGQWHATGILRDITDRKRIEVDLIEAREAALNAARVKSEFLSNMSHEIRTPLNAIIGMADLLWETRLSAEQADYVRISRNAGEGLLNLINDILDISRADAGHIALESIPFSLPDLVEKTCETLSMRAHEKGIGLACSINPATPVWVLGDPDRIRQVLINLVGNAVKFTESGEVNVIVRPESDDRIYIGVSDTGIGIPEGKLESIFQSFIQVDSSHSRRFGGTGLGLAISKKLVESMKGEISVESREGVGSTFSMMLKLPVAELPEGVPAGGLEPIGNALILAVDDNVNHLSILKSMLAEWGGDCVTAEGGESALALFREASAGSRRFDLCILDFNMPGMTGLDLAARLRREGLFEGPIILLVSSDSSAEIKATCQELGITSHLVKPVGAELLHGAIVAALKSAAAPHGRIPAVHKALNRPLRVLVAEDSPENRFLLMRYLTALPWEVVQVENGREALQAFEASRFDLILMDMQMPLMDGFEATAAIRRSERERGAERVPIVALTAYAMKEEVERCIKAGCDFHVSKPIRKTTLFQRFEEILAGTDAVSDEETLFPATEAPLARVPEDLMSLIPGYLENRRNDIFRIQTLLSEDGFAEVERLAHSMKGTGGGYGFDGISSVGGAMESAARNRNIEEVRKQLDALEIYIRTVRIEYVNEE